MDMGGMMGVMMDDDTVRSGLLEQLMGLMDSRIAGEAMPEHANKKRTAPVQVATGPSGDGKDSEMDKEMMRIIRQKRGY